MRIVIEAGLFARKLSPEERGELLALFIAAQKGPHSIEVSPENAPDFLRWVEEFDPATREMLWGAVLRGVKARARSRRRFTIHVADVKSASWKEKRLPLEVATRIAGQPLTLLLESGINEPAFLQAVSRIQKDFDIERLKKERAVDYRTYGGIQANWKWLEANAHDPEVASRHWVLCDSDARRPWKQAPDGSVPSGLGSGADRLARCCLQHGVRHHILRRRFIESYLPLPAVQWWASLDPPQRPESRMEKYDAFARMTPEQRHHFNMKGGFAQDAKDVGRAHEAGDLYETMSEPDKRTLHEGLDVKIADLFRERHQIQPSWLRNDGQSAELEAIIDAILELV